MDATSALRKGLRICVACTALAASFFSVLGCDEPAAQAQPKEGSAVESATSSPQPSEPSAGKPSYEEEAFQLRLEGPASVTAGSEAVFKVILTAQSGYKVNDEYPLKFQFAETAQVRPAKTTVRKEDATVEKQRAEMPLSVTVEAPGKHKVSGKLSFSVCTEERCLIEKRDLTLSVDAT